MLTFFLKMIFILFLCPVMLGAGVLTVTIDTQLGTSIEDCFERISIGEQIPASAIYRNVSELTTRECETICKQDKQCQSYDYGVGAKGNATCDLSMADEKTIKEKSMLLRHPDYDVYVRRLNCEQSPPLPMEPQSDDPNEGPHHKPVFRPNEDDRRPLHDDLKPFESFRPEYKPIPPYRPHREPLRDPYRPDDYTNSKPVIDSPPSYGDHRPPNIPYIPDKPNYKPDPYDELQFKPTHDRPQRPPNPALWRPDPYHPPQPSDNIPDLYGPKPKPQLPPIQPYVPTEKPVYHYIIRPPKKPYQSQGHRPDYGQDYYDSSQAGYGQEQISNRPYDYPNKPYDKPTYNHNTHYAGSYGYNQEPIYVEIVDPPRPYKPIKPNRPSYGGFDQDNQLYSQSQSNGYGVNQSNHGQRPPNDYGARPQRPPSYGAFGADEDQHYSLSLSNGYVPPNQGYGDRPQNEGIRPGYQQPHVPSHSYGSGSAFDSYPVTENPVYEYYQRPQTYIPSDNYYESMNRPSNGYGIAEPPIYKPPYNTDYNKPIDQRPSYGDQSEYLDNSPSYGGYKENQYRPNNYEPATTHRPYPVIQSSVITVDKSDGGYGNRPAYDKQPSYGKDPNPSYNKEPSYGKEPYPAYGKEPSASYGHQQSTAYTEKPNSYIEPTPSYEKPGYGNSKPNYEQPSSTYGEQRPNYDRPNSYGEQKPSYENTASYGEQKPSHQNTGSSYGEQKPSYQNTGSTYGEQKPTFEIPNSYGEPKPVYEKPTSSYGEQKPYEPSQTYGHQPSPTYAPEPTPAYGSPSSSYGQSEYKNKYTTPAFNYSESGYNRPDPKPVYEYERPEEPSFSYGPNGEQVTSKPVAVSGYGKQPGYGGRKHMNYDGK